MLILPYIYSVLLNVCKQRDVILLEILTWLQRFPTLLGFGDGCCSAFRPMGRQREPNTKKEHKLLNTFRCF